MRLSRYLSRASSVPLWQRKIVPLSDILSRGRTQREFRFPTMSFDSKDIIFPLLRAGIWGPNVTPVVCGRNGRNLGLPAAPRPQGLRPSSHGGIILTEGPRFREHRDPGERENGREERKGGGAQRSVREHGDERSKERKRTSDFAARPNWGGNRSLGNLASHFYLFYLPIKPSTYYCSDASFENPGVFLSIL